MVFSLLLVVDDELMLGPVEVLKVVIWLVVNAFSLPSIRATLLIQISFLHFCF
jgi:hypothetical protein